MTASALKDFNNRFNLKTSNLHLGKFICWSETISWWAPEAAPLDAAIWDAVPLDAVYVPHALSAATCRAIFAVSDREEAALSTASLLG